MTSGNYNNDIETDLFQSSIDMYAEEIEDKHRLFLRICALLRKTISAAGLDMTKFRIDHSNFSTFMSMDLLDEVSEFGPVLGPSANAFIGDDLYVAASFVSIEEDGYGLDAAVYRLKDHAEGNREWVVFNEEEGAWKKGPGKNFFGRKLWQG